MRLVIRGIEPQALRINPNHMRPVMLDQIVHPLLQDLIRSGLREREQMLRRVLFLLVDPAAFDAYRVEEELNYR